jgi:hypothetical protein
MNWLEKKTQTTRIIFKSSSFDRGIRIGVAIALPSAAVFLGYFKYALPLLLLNAPETFLEVSNVGQCHLSKYWTNNGITTIILFSKPFLPLL